MRSPHYPLGGRPDPNGNGRSLRYFCQQCWHSDPTFIVQVTDSKRQCAARQYAQASTGAGPLGISGPDRFPPGGNCERYRYPEPRLVAQQRVKRVLTDSQRDVWFVGLCTPAFYRRVGGQRRLLSHGFWCYRRHLRCPYLERLHAAGPGQRARAGLPSTFRFSPTLRLFSLRLKPLPGLLLPRAQGGYLDDFNRSGAPIKGRQTPRVLLPFNNDF